MKEYEVIECEFDKELEASRGKYADLIDLIGVFAGGMSIFLFWIIAYLLGAC